MFLLSCFGAVYRYSQDYTYVIVSISRLGVNITPNLESFIILDLVLALFYRNIRIKIKKSLLVKASFPAVRQKSKGNIYAFGLDSKAVLNLWA